LPLPSGKVVLTVDVSRETAERRFYWLGFFSRTIAGSDCVAL
jgi:hypothetical protein